MIREKFGNSMGFSSNSRDYYEVFLNHVHRLILMGYHRMNPQLYATEEETTITGELVSAIEDACDRSSASWTRFYSVHDDAPVNYGGKKGKSRSRVDIRIDSALRTPRARFSIEAKRLNKTAGASAYLGQSGLGCFLSGDYSRESEHAGMLGYVQAGGAKSWAGKLATSLTNDPKKYQIAKGGNWDRVVIIPSLKHTYVTRHRRSCGTPEISVYHTLLVFY